MDRPHSVDVSFHPPAAQGWFQTPVPPTGGKWEANAAGNDKNHGDSMKDYGGFGESEGEGKPLCYCPGVIIALWASWTGN